jgi:hypothetical protein
MLLDCAAVIIDTRNIYARSGLVSDRIIKA